MPESDIAWTRVFVVFLVLLLGAASLTGIVVYSRFARADSPAAGADVQTLTQIQKQLTIIEDRLSDLESHPKTSKRTSRQLDEPERGACPANPEQYSPPRSDPISSLTPVSRSVSARPRPHGDTRSSLLHKNSRQFSRVSEHWRSKPARIEKPGRQPPIDLRK